MTILEHITGYPSLLRLVEYDKQRFVVSTIPDKGAFLEEEALDAVDDVLSMLRAGAGEVVRVMAQNCCNEAGDRLCDCVDAIEFVPDLSFSCPK